MKSIDIADTGIGEFHQSIDPGFLFERHHQQDRFARAQGLREQARQTERVGGKGQGHAAEQVEPGLGQRQKSARRPVAGILDPQLDAFGGMVEGVVRGGGVRRGMQIQERGKQPALLRWKPPDVCHRDSRAPILPEASAGAPCSTEVV
jgi:hypothetical protein